MEPGVGHEDPSGCLSAQDDSMILSSMTAVGVFFGKEHLPHLVTWMQVGCP